MVNNLSVNRLVDEISALGNTKFPCLIERLLPDPTFAMIHAVAKTGKTRFATQLAIALASGSSFLGRNIEKPKKVCYMDQELGSKNFAFRIRDSNLDLNGAEENFWISIGRLALSEPSGFGALRSLIHQEKIEVLIIDCLAQIHSFNENQSNEMLPIISGLKDLKDETDCSILLVHHQGKKHENSGSGPQSFRGSSILLDVVDVSFGLFKSKSTNVRVEVTSRYFTSETINLIDNGAEFILSEAAAPKNEPKADIEAETLKFLEGKGKVLQSDLSRSLAKITGFSTKTISRTIKRLVDLNQLAMYQEGNKYSIEIR